MLPEEKGSAELVFQIMNLAGNGGLGNVETGGRAANILLRGGHDEVAKVTEFHIEP
jgi:hypothetical protein